MRCCVVVVVYIFNILTDAYLYVFIGEKCMFNFNAAVYCSLVHLLAFIYTYHTE